MYRARWIDAGKTVALKCVHPTSSQNRLKNEILHLIALQLRRRLSSPRSSAADTRARARRNESCVCRLNRIELTPERIYLCLDYFEHVPFKVRSTQRDARRRLVFTPRLRARNSFAR